MTNTPDTSPEAVERHDDLAEPGMLPIPTPQQCVEDLRDDGYHPQATCVERLMREASYHQQELDGIVTRLRRSQARAKAAEAERDALKAALSEAVGVIRPFATAWKIATASGLTGMGQLGTLARGETVGIHFMRARAFLARHQKEKDT